MTWTYTINDLATSAKDRVRFEIGDTDTNAQLLADEEILQAIATERNEWGAAARCCEIVSRQMLRKADVRIGRGGTSIDYTTAAKQYAEMAKALRAKALGTAVPWAGGVNISEKADLAEDSGRVQPIFTKTMQENPRVGGQGSDTATDDGQANA